MRLFISPHRIFTMSAAPSAAPATISASAAASQENLPTAATLQHAARLAIKEDKPILLDYFLDTATGKAFMGEDQESKTRMLVKSNDEFTSVIQKVYKVQEEYIIMTENSIYIASKNIQKRRIQASSLHNELDEFEVPDLKKVE